MIVSTFLLLIGAGGCNRAEKMIGEPVALIPAPATRPPVEGAFLLGINEAVAIPHRKYPEEPEPQRLGLVSSGTLSPSLNAGIGLGYVPPAFAKPGTVIRIEIRGRVFAAEVVAKPIYRRA